MGLEPTSPYVNIYIYYIFIYPHLSNVPAKINSPECSTAESEFSLVFVVGDEVKVDK